MTEADHPRLDADEIFGDAAFQAARVVQRIESDPVLAERSLGVLVETPHISEEKMIELKHTMGEQGVDEILAFKAIITSGLYRWFSYDRKTQEAIDSDPRHQKLLAEHRENRVPNNDREAHKLRIAANELRHFAGRVGLVKQPAVPEASNAQLSDTA